MIARAATVFAVDLAGALARRAVGLVGVDFARRIEAGLGPVLRIRRVENAHARTAFPVAMPPRTLSSVIFAAAMTFASTSVGVSPTLMPGGS